jgi:hypothetical protein
MTDLIDRSKTTRLIEQRIAKTTNPRHLLMLKGRLHRRALTLAVQGGLISKR